jgi:hypothetical protein
MKTINLLLFLIIFSFKLISQTENNTQFKSKNEEFHTNKLDEPTRVKWTELKGKLEQLEGVKFDYKKGGIYLKYDKKLICSFVGTSCCLIIEIIRGDIKSNSYFTLNEPNKISKEVSWKPVGFKKIEEYVFPINKDSNIDYIFFLIKQKYDSLK